MESGHAKTWQEVVDYFQTDVEKGLSEDQVKKYQEKYGPNGMSDMR
jgi:Ca2+ transporting ATPase